MSAISTITGCHGHSAEPRVHHLVDALLAADEVVEDDAAEAVVFSLRADHLGQALTAVQADERAAVRDKEDRDAPVVLDLPRALLVRALERIMDVARRAGGKIIVVDAIDERAAAFYERHDFVRLPGNPQRLVTKMSTAARALGESWP